jgi:flagellar hook-associated protein 3 FlgL
MSLYRVSTANTYDRALLNIQQRQLQMGVSQEQLSSGKRVAKASDDAVAATLSERTQNRLARTDADLRGLEASRRSLAQAESTLGSVSELYARVRELVTQAGGGALNASDKSTIAGELLGIREQIVAFANQKDTTGSPLFSGLGSLDASGASFLETSFVPVATSYGPDGRAVNWEALDGQYAATATALPRSVDGARVFGGAAGNIWETLDRAIGALESNLSGSLLTTELDLVHADLSTRHDDLLAARGKLGDWLNRADNMELLFKDRSVAYQKENSELTDVDMVKAVTDFEMNQTAYQAALQSYAQVQKMSMFDYLR